MSWGDHDTDLINKKLNVDGRLKEEQKQKLSKEQELYFVHKKDNEDRNLNYRDRDWFQLGWDEAMKQRIIQKPEYGYKNNFAKNLKIIRVAFGYTMEELHNQCGVAMQTIGKYEAGDTEPSISNLIKLAESLNVSVAYLVGAELKLEIKECGG
jgi:DNA-binding XRE family transcriptional regulator